MPQVTRGRRPVKRRKGRDFRAPLLVVFISFVVVMLLICPWKPVEQARNVSGEGGAMYTGLVISEIMADNNTALPDEKGEFSDWVELRNTSDAAMNLEGLTLSDRSDKAIFLFPRHVLAPGESVIVFCDGTNRNAAGGAFHAKFKLSSLGDSVFLFNPSGFVIANVSIPTLNMNESYARMEDGAYEVTELYSPGYPNTEEGHVSYLANYTVEADTLMFSEIMPAPRSGLKDADGDYSDWIELYNASTERIYLRNYALSDNENRLLKWFFPQDAYIEPGQYYVVFCSGKDMDGADTGFPHTNFSLAADGEVVTLANALGQLVDRVSYENVPVDCSYSRDMSRNLWRVSTLATPGVSNDEAGAARADEYLRALNYSHVYISEVMSSNDTVKAIAGEANKDWVELYNAGAETVDLSGFGLSDNINWPRKWTFPQGSAIWPGEYKIILLDGSKQSGTDASRLHASFKLARAGAETITLSDALGNVLDKLYLPEIPTDYSYGRTWGVDGFFYYDAPSPGAPNAIGFKGFTQAPEFETAGGLYSADVAVSIAVPPGASVRYTTDGSVPTLSNGTVYVQPFQLIDTACVRARAFSAGLQPSAVITTTYVLKTLYTLPVVCLVGDPDELFGNTAGIMAAGEGVDLLSYAKIPFKNPKPLYRLQKEAGVWAGGFCEMYTPQGETVCRQGVDMGLIGQYSLDMPQKSLKVTARARYGSKYINGALFADRPFTQYRSFVLRNGGNDCVWTRMVDGVQSRLADTLGTPVIHQSWQPVIVYINGLYWGHYNMRERVSEYFVAQHEGLELDQAKTITVLESNGTASSQVNNGSNAEWKEFIGKVKTLSPGSSDADLQYILDNIDVDNYFDYVILECYFANTDSGNIRFYKVPGGKWKWLLYDMDYGLYLSNANGVGNYFNPKGHGANDDIDNTLILKILENAVMRDRFLARFGEVFNLLNTQVMLSQIEACYQLLLPEMDVHFTRWAEENLKSISADQPQSKDGCMRYWKNRVERLRNVARKRPAYCWRQVAEWFKLTDAQMTAYFGPLPLIPTDATWDSDTQRDTAMSYIYGASWRSLYQ